MISRNAYPIDIHSRMARSADHQPLKRRPTVFLTGCCCPRIEGLLVVGDAFLHPRDSGRSAHAAIGYGPGQAGGTAAALAVKAGCSPRKIDIEELQTTLRSQKVNI